jgi:hypothetical protein
VFEIRDMDGRTVFQVTDQGRLISEAGFDVNGGHFSP